MKWIKELFSVATPVYIEIRGREAVLAEGYCKIESYSETYICLANSESRFAVCGSGLKIRHLSESAVAVDGRIDRIEFV